MGGAHYGYRPDGVYFPRRRTITKTEYDKIVKDMEPIRANPNLANDETYSLGGFMLSICGIIYFFYQAYNMWQQ